MNRIFVRFLLVLLVGVIFVYSSVQGQATFHAVKDFIGYDQNLYMHVSMYFTEDFWTQAYNGYQLQRIIPFALINILFNLFQITFSPENLTNAMIICNILALGVSIFYFFRISVFLNWNIATEIITFSILFVNIHTLSGIEYMPFNTDEFALLSSIIMLDAFYKRRQVLLLGVGLIGAFIWPTLFISALILFLFKPLSISVMDKPNDRKDTILLDFIKVGAIVVALPILIMTYIVYAPSKTINGFAEIYEGHWYGYNYINIYVTAIAILSLMYFIYKMLKPFQFSVIELLKKIIENITIKRLIVVCLMYGVMKIFMLSFSNNEHYWDMAGMLKHTVLRSTALPFIFLEAHFMYFGLIVVLLLFNWKKAIAAYSRLGLGYLMIIAMFLILCVNPESRYMIYLLPFVVIPFMSEMNFTHIKKYIPWTFLCGQLLLSRFWLPKGDEWLLNNLYFDIEHFSMNGTTNGAFQHVEMYVVGSIALLVVMFIYYYCRKFNYFQNSKL